MDPYIWGNTPEWIFMILVYAPLLLCCALITLLLALFIVVMLPYKILQIILYLFGVNFKIDTIDCLFNDPSPKCRKSEKKKSILSYGWYFTKHPSAMIIILIKNLKLLLQKSKLDKITCKVCSSNCQNSVENKIKEKGTKQIFKSENNCLSVYYPLLLSAYFWSRVAILWKSNGKDTPDNWVYLGITILHYLICLLFVYGDMLVKNTIPTENHMHAKTTAKFLTSLKVKCILNIKCYHSEGSDDDRHNVTTYTAKIQVPMKEWMDNEKFKYEDAATEIENILKKNPFFTGKVTFDCKPINSETEKDMRELRQHHINKNKHRDESISANFSFQARKENGKIVNKIVVHRDGYDVPNYWLGSLFSCVSAVLLIFLGLALSVMLVLLLKRNVKLMVLSKDYEMSKGEGI